MLTFLARSPFAWLPRFSSSLRAAAGAFHCAATVSIRARSFRDLAIFLQPVGLAHPNLEPQPEHLVVDLAQLACAFQSCVRDPGACLFLHGLVLLRCLARRTNLVFMRDLVRRQPHRLLARSPRVTPSISNRILPGRTTATHSSGAPFPLPIRVSAGFLVIGLSGNNRIQTLPPRLMNRVMAIRPLRSAGR